MLTRQRPPVRTLALLLPITALWVIGLWTLLQPAHGVAQQAETATTMPPTVTSVVTSTLAPKNSAVPKTPTPGITVITPTPEQLDVFGAATQSVRLTEQAMREGTPTPLPPNVRIATRTPTPRVVTATPTAANRATATFHAVYATAVAFTTGTPNIVIATPTPTAFIITPTPQPVDVLEAATRKAQQEAQAQRGETPTPLPNNFLVATVTRTPRIVTNTPLPENDATATAQAIYATAVAYTTGVPHVVTATPRQATPTPQAAGPGSDTTTRAGEYTVIRRANLRSGPGTNYAVVGVASPGQKLAVIGTSSDGKWLQLKNGDWIAAFLVTAP